MRDSRGRFVARKRNPTVRKPKPGKPSKAEATKRVEGYNQLTLTETGNAKKDYLRVPLFRMNPSARYNKGSIDSAIHAAQRTSDADHPKYVVALYGGFTVTKDKPASFQRFYEVRGASVKLHG